MQQFPPTKLFHAFALVLMIFLPTGCQRIKAQGSQPEQPTTTITDIHIAPTIIRTGVKHFGINIAGQNYYDSGQMMRNLVFSNPGFEGESWQSILQCATASSMRCTDADQWNQWPANFLQGAQFEFLSGPAFGITGTITSSDAANPANKNDGVSLHFDRVGTPPNPGDFILVRKSMPGNADAGWWTNTWAGGAFSTETKDIAPDSPGKQCIRLTAPVAGQSAGVSSYFDSFAGRSFVQLKGPYRITFRAKGLSGNNNIAVSLRRQTPNQPEIFLSKSVALSGRWQNYTLDFTAAEHGDAIGTMALSFNVSGAEVLLDDVSLAPARATTGNPTAFRDEVVETLLALKPGVLRYQDGDHLGSSIDNLIAPAFGRVRAGWSERTKEQDGIPLGLPEFLQLARTVGAEPWFNMPAGISEQETRNLIEYLAGAPTTPYGARRAAAGQPVPWTDLFPVIHLELGNEEWNGPTFAGAAMNDPVVYGQRARQIFLAARSHPAYRPAKFDLVIGTFALIPEWTRNELAHSGGYDSTAAAPYLFGQFNDDSSTEAIFGPMFAQPERFDSGPNGVMFQQAKVAREAAHPAKLSVYEVNTGAVAGSVSQASFDRVIPSLGSSLALADHMLMMLRDLDITTQSVWSLPGYENVFQNSVTQQNENSHLFGVVVDMGGETNLRRPTFIAEQLTNESMLANMLKTSLSGANPTWNQAQSTNDDVLFSHAHMLQTFAFADGPKRTLVIFNLSRTAALPVTISGEAPAGRVKVRVLTSANLDDTNEIVNTVATRESVLPAWDTKTPYSVPRYSMTVLSWNADH